uniref:recQ-mediated genome instability protein 1-like n=1 Tax=Styela clava TaxID=7725 RepID=UPI00193A8201|nr:recQ-mediated genome instability protein 1-like [Styela clava]
MSTSTNAISAWFKSKHISVPNDWVSACLEWLQSENSNTTDPTTIRNLVYEQWLLTDLRDFGEGCLPSEITNDAYTLKGIYCVQIDNVLDVSQPKYSQLLQRQNKENSNMFVCAETQATQKPWEAKPSRMLMMSITDGVQEISGMEYTQIPKINEKITPGTKITIQGPVICRRGVMMLKQNNIDILGGEVEDMFQSCNYEAMLCRGLNRPIPTNPTAQTNISEANTRNETPQNRTINVANPGQRNLLGSGNQSRNQPNSRNENARNRTNVANSNQSGHGNYIQNRTINTKTNQRRVLGSFENQAQSSSRDVDVDFDDAELDQIMADADFDDSMDDAVLSSLVSTHFEDTGSCNQKDCVTSSTSTIKNIGGKKFDIITISDDEEGIDDLLADADLDKHLVNNTNEQQATNSTNIGINNPKVPKLSNSAIIKKESKMLYQKQAMPGCSSLEKQAINSSNFGSKNTEVSKLSNSVIIKKESETLHQKQAMPGSSLFQKPTKSDPNSMQRGASGNFPQPSKTNISYKQEYRPSQHTEFISPKKLSTHTNRDEASALLMSDDNMEIFDDDIPVLNSRNETKLKPKSHHIQASTIPQVKPSYTLNSVVKKDPECPETNQMDYLCQAKVFLSKYQGRKEINVRSKCIVVTLLSKLRSDAFIGWGLKARICDGTDTLDAEFSNEVLRKLIGFTVPEAEAVKASQNTQQREKLKAGMQNCRATIISMCHFMNIKIFKTATSSTESFITSIEL